MTGEPNEVGRVELWLYGAHKLDDGYARQPLEGMMRCRYRGIDGRPILFLVEQGSDRDALQAVDRPGFPNEMKKLTTLDQWGFTRCSLACSAEPAPSTGCAAALDEYSVPFRCRQHNHYSSYRLHSFEAESAADRPDFIAY